MPIHPTAIVDARAVVDTSAEVGAFCIVGAEVHIGARTRLMAHVYLEGVTHIGEDNLFYPYSSVGVASQDLKYKGERAETRIGDGNTIREFVTIHRGTEGGGLATSIGNKNLLMAYTHVAHDVHVGSHCVLANAVTFAGHVTVGDWAVIGAHTGVHQFCRVGRHAMIGGYSVVVQDVLPFSLTTGSGREIRLFDVNQIGLERRGYSKDSIAALHRAFRLLRDPKLNTSKAVAAIQEEPATAEVEEVLAFIAQSERGIIK